MIIFRDYTHLRQLIRAVFGVQQISGGSVDFDPIVMSFQATLLGTRAVVVQYLASQFGNHCEDMTPTDCNELHTFVATMRDGTFTAVRLKFRDGDRRVWSTIEHDFVNAEQRLGAAS